MGYLSLFITYIKAYIFPLAEIILLALIFVELRKK